MPPTFQDHHGTRPECAKASYFRASVSGIEGPPVQSASRTSFPYLLLADGEVVKRRKVVWTLSLTVEHVKHAKKLFGMSTVL
jgi:hypothetical protein